jgi:hypothetical protein
MHQSREAHPLGLSAPLPPKGLCQGVARFLALDSAAYCQQGQTKQDRASDADG